jgi:hypothetical protein
MNEEMNEGCAEHVKAWAGELMRRRGERDGKDGFNPSSTSPDYFRGYLEGRRFRVEQKIRYGEKIAEY